MNKVIVAVVTCFIYQISFSQNHKFGKVSKEELEEKFYPLDSMANAAYLYKNRRSYFKYVQGQGYKVVTEVHERIKIYNREGYEWATKEIEFYHPSSSESEKVNVSAAKTFSLIDGKVQVTKLEKSDVFVEKKNKYWSEKKFTMPNLSEGCVVEWKFILDSPYYGINNVEVQYAIPVKKYKSSIEIPEYFSYHEKVLGYLPLNVQTSVKNSTINLTLKSRTLLGRGATETNFDERSIKLETNVSLIEKENILAFIEEPYVDDIDNYRAGVQYELASIKFPQEIPKHFSQTWEDVAKTIYESPDFGGELKKHSHLLDDVAIMKSKYKTDSEKIHGALDYVKSKIKWNNYHGKYAEKGLRRAYKEGSGNISDVNLSLVVVLRELGLSSYPVLVSTRDNGVPTFPTLSGFNYVIAMVSTNEGKTLLDASEKYSLPNVLPLRVLNWRGTVVKEGGRVEFVSLESNNSSLEESNMSYKFSGEGLIEGMNRVTYKNMKSIDYRNNKGRLKEDDLIYNIEEENDDIKIINFKLFNKDNFYKPIVAMYTFEKEDGIEIIGDKMYVEPLLFNGITENPFKIENREYPVDFGAPWKDKYTVKFEIPEGYKIESIPESLGVGFTDDLAKFVYSIKNQEKSIQVTSILEIKRGVIPANYYKELKDLFKQVVSKQTEKIVLSKI